MNSSDLYSYFVYGTLRPDCPKEYSWKSDFLRGMVAKKAKLPHSKMFFDQYPLLILGQDNPQQIPISESDVTTGFYVTHEAQATPPEKQTKMSFVDQVEDCPNWYKRTIVKVKLDEDNSEHEAWVYHIPNGKTGHPVPNNDWLVFHNEQDSTQNNNNIAPAKKTLQEMAQDYLNNYPDKQDDSTIDSNCQFYSNQIAYEPQGQLIEDFLRTKQGDYDFLEKDHNFIQWLFPIQEQGLNRSAKPLQKHEIQEFKKDPEIMKRVQKVYELILDFFGMKLKDPKTGQVARSDNFAERYANLNFSSHNYLRITRILKFLGEIGLEHYKLPFIQFVLLEIYDNEQLKNTYKSLIQYWTPILRSEKDRQIVQQFVEQRGPLPIEEGFESGAVAVKKDCPHLSTVTPFPEKNPEELKTLFFEKSICSLCDNQQENWICLHCYQVFCGRFAKKHMIHHRENIGEDKVAVAVGSTDLSFWCYDCDSYLGETIPEVASIYEQLLGLKFG